MNNIQLTKQLIAIKSITDSQEESKPLELIKSLLDKEHIDYFLVGKGPKKNLVAEIGKGEKTVVFNSHFDVVPGREILFSSFEKDGKLYGRGSADAKGPLASMLVAFLNLKQQKLPGKILFCCVCDEENAGLQGTRMLVEKGVIGDYHIIGEPTDCVPIIAEKGFLRLMVTVQGKERHAAFPNEKDNAIVIAGKVIEALASIDFGVSHSLLGTPTISFGILSGGKKINIGAGNAAIGIDIRYLPSQKPHQIIKKIQSIVSIFGSISIDIISSGIPFETPETSILVDIAKKISGNSPSGVNFGTDARFYAPKDAIILGPGKSDIAHQEIEYVNMKDLQKSVQIYELIVKHLLS